MKNMKMIKRILSAVLCICMISGALFILASCDTTPSLGATEESITVVRVKTAIKANTKLTADMFETVKVPESAVPLNAIRDVRKIEGKYSTQAFYVGEYVFAGKLTDTDPATKKFEYDSNIVVTEKMDKSKDFATELQRIIDENPTRTIEIPDGSYVLSKPVKVSADPTKAVSLRLSDFAVIKAADGWSSAEAMFCLSDGEIPEGKELTDTFYLQGGTLDGNGKAVAVNVANAENLLISGVDFKNVKTAINVENGIVDAENCDVVGAGEDSVGLKVAADYGTYTNFRITNVGTGVEISGDNNVLKSVYVTYTGTAATSVGFKDTSARGSNYDMCTSENFATGFSMGNATCIYYACFVKWNGISSQVAFASTGKFNSVIRTTRVDFAAGSNGSFLTAATAGGAGQVLWPMIGGKANMANTSYTAYLNGTTTVER